MKITHIRIEDVDGMTALMSATAQNQTGAIEVRLLGGPGTGRRGRVAADLVRPGTGCFRQSTTGRGSPAW